MTEIMDDNTKTPAPEPVDHTTTHRNRFKELLQIAAFALFFAFVIKAFFLQAFKIPTGSMEDTLLIGDFLLVNKFIYGAQTPEFVPWTDIPLRHWRLPGLRQPQPGDVIVFRHPQDPSIDYIKRCIATEGQTVEIRNKAVFVDGTSFREVCNPVGLKFEDPDTIARDKGYDGVYPKHAGSRDNYGPVTVPTGTLFAMGDNRDRSYDSRNWGFIPYDNVIGKAMCVYWSVSPNDPLDIRWNRIGRIIE